MKQSFEDPRTAELVLERLSPLVREHIEFHGKYSVEVPDVVRQGRLRPLPHSGA